MTQIIYRTTEGISVPDWASFTASREELKLDIKINHIVKCNRKPRPRYREASPRFWSDKLLSTRNPQYCIMTFNKHKVTKVLMSTTPDRLAISHVITEALKEYSTVRKRLLSASGLSLVYDKI